MSTLAELSRTRRQSNEDLGVYLRILRENALDCCDPVREEMLVGVRLHGMIEEYRVFLESLSFPFSLS